MDPGTGSRAPAELPTAPSSVVWSGGHAFVLERAGGRARWIGVDDRGRVCLLSAQELERRGWSRSCR